MRPSNLQTTIYRLCVLSSLMFFASAGNATSSNNPINLDDVNGPFTYTLVISNGISDNSPLFLNDGANLDLNDDNETIGSLAGDGNVFLGSGTLTTGSAGSTTFNGVISESGGLTKVGGTTFTLTGDSTYDGLTTINGGALTLDGSLDAGNNVELAMSNTTLNGTGEIIGAHDPDQRGSDQRECFRQSNARELTDGRERPRFGFCLRSHYPKR